MFLTRKTSQSWNSRYMNWHETRHDAAWKCIPTSFNSNTEHLTPFSSSSITKKIFQYTCIKIVVFIKTFIDQVIDNHSKFVLCDNNISTAFLSTLIWLDPNIQHMRSISVIKTQIHFQCSGALLIWRHYCSNNSQSINDYSRLIHLPPLGTELNLAKMINLYNLLSCFQIFDKHQKTAYTLIFWQETLMLFRWATSHDACTVILKVLKVITCTYIS